MTTRPWMKFLATAFFLPAMVALAQQPPDGNGFQGGGRQKGQKGGGRGFGSDQGGVGGGRSIGGDQGGNSGDQGGGPGRMIGADPSAFFDRLSNGKDVLVRSELDDMGQRMFDRLAQRNNLTGDRITRQQFVAAMSAQGQPGGGPMTITMSRDNSGGGMTMSPDRINSMAEARFRQGDVDQDGYLSPNEMSERLRSEWQKWDTNKDGAIDLQEYKAYMAATFAQPPDISADPNVRGANSGLPPELPKTAPTDEERKPVVYRSGKLPRGIPAWFEQLDVDRDGQVGLYEWVNDGRSVEDFKAMDRNDDGFVTVEEVMATVRGTTYIDGSVAVASAGSDMGRSGFGNGMGGGQRGFGGGGRGGPGGNADMFGGGRGGRGGPGVGGMPDLINGGGGGGRRWNGGQDNGLGGGRGGRGNGGGMPDWINSGNAGDTQTGFGGVRSGRGVGPVGGNGNQNGGVPAESRGDGRRGGRGSGDN